MHGGLRRLLTAVAAAAVMAAATLAGAVPGAAAATTAPAYTYQGSWHGVGESLTRVRNVTVESLPDATVVGQLDGFQTDDPAYTCLDGEDINVWTAPAEFPGLFVAHNGEMGTQCTYGTWTFPQKAARAAVTLALGLPPAPVAAGGGATVTGTLSAPVSDGWIGFRATGPGGTMAGARCVPSAGRCTVTLRFGAAGAWTVRAAWTGDAAHLTARTAATLNVAAANAAIVVLTVGSRLVRIGSATWVAPAAPVVQGQRLLAPLATLARVLGARVRRNGRQLLLARGTDEALLVAGTSALASGTRVQPSGGGPVVLGGVWMVPLLPVARSLGATLRLAPGTRALTAGGGRLEIICCSGGGGGGGGGGGPPITVTQTFTAGWSGAPLNGQQGLTYQPTSTSTWLGCYGYCGQGKGGLVDGADQPGSGFVGLGTAALGFATATSQQSMGVSFTPLAAGGSPLPAGTPVALHVRAQVFPVSLTFGLSGAGVSCAPTSVDWSAPGGVAAQHTLADCLGSLAVSVPIPGSADDSALESAVESFGENVAENFGPWCVENPDECAQDGQLFTDNAGALSQAMGNWLQLAQDLGPLVGVDLKFYHPVDFTWDGIAQGGQAQDFSVSPQAVAEDYGAGLMVNSPYFYVLISITEQYAENQYAYTFPAAEVGQPLLGNSLQQCGGGLCQAVQANSVQVVGGSLPSGMTATAQNGWAVLTGAPAAGSEGTYTFSLQVDGADVYHCTLTVAPPLALATTGSTIVWEQGASPAPGFNALPVEASGGVGAYVWSLQPGWSGQYGEIYVAYGPDGPPVVVAGPDVQPGTYPFHATVYDYYTNATSRPITLQVLPPLAVDNSAMPAAAPYTPYNVALAATGVQPYAWHLVSGSLPPGVQLAANGVLSGTPEGADAGQTYAFTVGVSDGAGGSAQRAFSVAVASGGTAAVSVNATDSLLGWWYRCATIPNRGRVCLWVHFGDSTALTAVTTGLPAGTTVSFRVSPSAGVTLSAGSCTTDSSYRCSVDMKVATQPQATTTYTVSAAAAGARNTTQVTYGVK